MRGNPQEEYERTAMFILAVLLAPATLAYLVPHLAAQAGAWLLAHHVLVPAAQSLVILPGLGAGVDGARLGLLGCLALAAALTARQIRTRLAGRHG